MAAQNPRLDLGKNYETISEPQPASKPEIEETISEKTPQHEINKTAVIVGVVGVVALMFIAMR